MKNKIKNFIKNKKWFTLIEMLIVIVIIWILAAAIIPRLNSARGRANDVARKADLNQVATALITYQLDTWKFPTTGATIDFIENELVAWWMTSIPRDPWNSNLFSWINMTSKTAWQYAYTTIEKNWISNWWFVLMAQMESYWQSNYIVCNEYDIIHTDSKYDDIELCWTITKWTSCDLAECEYAELSELRYIYKY